MDTLLDSVILIDHFNGVEDATAYLAETRGSAAISVVTRAEVLTGFDGSATDERAFLDLFPLLDLTKTVADLAAKLRREEGWKLPDAFQAAFAVHHGLSLATRNTRDFSPEKHEYVIVPYAL